MRKPWLSSFNIGHGKLRKVMESREILKPQNSMKSNGTVEEKQCSFDTWRRVIVLLLQRIEQEAKQEIEEAVKAAEADPDPTLDDLYLDLYADDNMEGHVVRGCDNWSRHATN